MGNGEFKHIMVEEESESQSQGVSERGVGWFLVVELFCDQIDHINVTRMLQGVNGRTGLGGSPDRRGEKGADIGRKPGREAQIRRNTMDYRSERGE